MFTIKKQFSFSAAHQLPGLEPDHPCGRLHGHNYKVEIILSSSTVMNGPGWIRDYRDLDLFKHFIDTQIDHRNLNEVVPMNTTAENLAFYFYNWCKSIWPEVTGCRVSETDKTWAEYSK